MQQLNSDIYKKMEDLKNLLTKENEKLDTNKQTKLEDLIFLGTIEWSEKDSTNTIIKIKKDIYASIEKKEPNQTIIKYYDDKNELIAINLLDINQIIPTSKYINQVDDSLSLKSQLNELKIEEGYSLNQINEELDKISKELNIPKEKILSISESDFSHNQENKEKDKIKIEQEDKPSQNNKNNPQTSKNNPNIKQETDLNQKINNKYTLGDILGIPQNGKLVTVYSSAVENNTNSTRFTFLIQTKEGQFLPCKNLEQIAGNMPTNDVYSSNYDGSSVSKNTVNSMYRVTSPFSNEGFVITANIGATGSIDLGLGQIPKMQGMNNTNTSIVTTPLKTTSTYNTTTEVKETLHSYNNSQYQSDAQNEEAQKHNDNCKLDIDSVDGDKKTGKQHLEKNEMLKIIEDLDLLKTKENEYSSDETLLYSLIHDYLSGNENPTKEEFLSACSRCENEHPRTRNR